MQYYQSKFEDYSIKHGLTFDNDEEYQNRLSIYSSHIDYITTSNAIQSNKFKLGETRFLHLSASEFRQYAGLQSITKSVDKNLRGSVSKQDISTDSIPNLSPSSIKNNPSVYPTAVQPKTQVNGPIVMALKKSSLPTKSPRRTSTAKPSSKQPSKKPSKKPVKSPNIPTRLPASILSESVAPLSPSNSPNPSPTLIPITTSATAPSFDWTVELNPSVWPIKDQGQCGSCWAFCTVAAMEASYYKKYGVLKSFSEQMLVSCAPQEGGCNGGNPIRVMFWLQSNGGLTTADQYPYTSGSSQQTGLCNPGYLAVTPPASPINVGFVQSLSDTALENAIDINPVIILLQADSLLFQLYTGGIINNPSCGGATLNHAIVAVGYGTLNGIRYIKARNSWGTNWYGYLICNNHY